MTEQRAVTSHELEEGWTAGEGRHTHTGACHDRSRYALVRVDVTILSTGSAEVRVAMKPSARCWSDLETTARARVRLSGLPQCEEHAAEMAVMAVREAYPGLF